MSTRILLIACLSLAACSPRSSGSDPRAALAAPSAACTSDDLPACQIACDQGSGDACTMFALKAFETQNFGVARVWADKACTLGSVCGCGVEGSMLFNGLGGARQPGKGEQLMKKGCSEGCAAVCISLGAAYAESEEPEKAAETWEHGCSMGSEGSCALLGQALVLGQGTKSNRTRGLKLLRKACESGLEWACDARTKLEKAKKPDDGPVSNSF